MISACVVTLLSGLSFLFLTLGTFIGPARCPCGLFERVDPLWVALEVVDHSRAVPVFQ